MKDKGVTLIALVTTIVILLILAGVTISQITGNGGLFSKTKQEVDKYGNAGDYEEKGLQQLSRYMLDFSIVGDSNISEEEKALVKITGMQIDTISTNSIKVTVTIEGTASKIEYSIDNGESWKTGESSTPNEYTFENLKAGSYVFRVKVYDVNSKIIEAISKIITIGEITTADVGNVLNGKTFWRNGEVKNGSMVDNGAVNPEALVAGAIYKIPAGYHNGNGTVTAKDLKSQTQGNATAAQILKNQIAWVNGSKIIGTMENRGEVKPGALSAGDSYIIQEGYHNGKGKVTTKSLAEQTPGTATAEDIATGKTAWVNGSRLEGKGKSSEVLMIDNYKLEFKTTVNKTALSVTLKFYKGDNQIGTQKDFSGGVYGITFTNPVFTTTDSGHNISITVGYTSGTGFGNFSFTYKVDDKTVTVLTSNAGEYSSRNQTYTIPTVVFYNNIMYKLVE